MKKSNKVLLYGLLASILLILLCLYSHQDMFINQKKELALESENRDEPLNSSATSIKENIEKSEVLPIVKLKEKEPEKPKSVDVPKNNATVQASIEENKTKVDEENSTVKEKNSSNAPAIRTIFKNKEEIKLKEHPKVEAPKEKVDEVDKNLPLEDNKPLIDNDKSKKSEEAKQQELKKAEAKKVEHKKAEAKKAEAKKADIKKEQPKKKIASKKVTTHQNKSSNKTLASIQESISTITNRNISFYKNRVKITDKSRAALNKVIKILKTVPNAKIVVKGYTDASGKEKTNLWISQERAKSVKRYLGKHGIPLKNIVAKGYGESELLYGDKPNSELNRRVTIEIKRK